MIIIKSDNKRDFMNHKYYWKFNMKFRLNSTGEVDEYYDDQVNACDFWLKHRTNGKWERYKNIIYFDNMNDMLMFYINFMEYIRNIVESKKWNTNLAKSVDDNIEAVKGIIIDIDTPSGGEILNEDN